MTCIGPKDRPKFFEVTISSGSVTCANWLVLSKENREWIPRYLQGWFIKDHLDKPQEVTLKKLVQTCVGQSWLALR